MAATDYCAQAARRRTAPRARQPYLARRSWGRRALALDSGDRGTHRGGSDTSRCVRTEHLRLGVRNACSARRLWRRPQALHPSLPAACCTVPVRLTRVEGAPWSTSADRMCRGVGGVGAGGLPFLALEPRVGTPGCPLLTKAGTGVLRGVYRCPCAYVCHAIHLCVAD